MVLVSEGFKAGSVELKRCVEVRGTKETSRNRKKRIINLKLLIISTVKLSRGNGEFLLASTGDENLDDQ